MCALSELMCVCVRRRGPEHACANTGARVCVTRACGLLLFFAAGLVLSRGATGLADESCCAATGSAATLNTNSARRSAREITV